jgi:hypothetical protein
VRPSVVARFALDVTAYSALVGACNKGTPPVQGWPRVSDIEAVQGMLGVTLGRYPPRD